MENLTLIAKYPKSEGENIVLYRRDTNLSIMPCEFVCWIEDKEGGRHWGRYSSTLEGGLEAFKKRLEMYGIIKEQEEEE